MHLSAAELARLELMVAAGQVRSDPPTLSPTDRTLDAMIQAAQMKSKHRPDAHRKSADTPSDSGKKGDGQHSMPDPNAANERRSNWETPRTLAELIQIRQALLRNEQPTSQAD